MVRDGVKFMVRSVFSKCSEHRDIDRACVRRMLLGMGAYTSYSIRRRRSQFKMRWMLDISPLASVQQDASSGRVRSRIRYMIRLPQRSGINLRTRGPASYPECTSHEDVGERASDVSLRWTGNLRGSSIVGNSGSPVSSTRNPHIRRCSFQSLLKHQ